jgi:flagellin
MASYISTNYASLQAQYNLSNSQNTLNKSIQRLSSGLRINSAADDAAGLAITDRMTSQINGLATSVNNANDAISLSQTADSALGSISSDLQNIRQLAVQASNSTNSASDRASLNQQAQQLLGDISAIAGTTQFNGINLLDGTFAGSNFQVGANQGQTIGMTLASANTNALGSFGGASTQAVSQTAFSASNYIKINGVSIGASSAVNANYGLTANSAAAKAAAINAQTSSTGVTASASTTATAGAAPAAGATSLAAGTITLNGVQLGSIIGTGAVSTGQSFAAAVNAVSAQTGVTATSDSGSGKITLSAQDGRDVILGDNSATAGAGLTALGFTSDTTLNTKAGSVNSSGTLVAATASATFTGTLTLNSASSFSLANGGAGTTALADAGLDPGAGTATSTPQPGGTPAATTAYKETLQTIGSLNLGSQSGATSALSVIDSAINQIDTQRGVLGADQNRFTQAVSNLHQSSVNLTTARSRIRDTDFASETANLSQAQILQQAGTAMLTQANSLPNSVLTLLKNA